MVKETKSDPTELVKNSIYFLTIYSIFTSILYLFGYWSIFNFNIFEFIALSDIFKYSIRPLALSLSAVIFLYIYTDILIEHAAKKIGELNLNPKKDRISQKIISFCVSTVKKFKAEVTIAIVLFSIHGPEIKWTIIPFIISIPICVAVSNIESIKNINIPEHIKLAILFLTIAFAAGSYSRGRDNALLISDGVSFNYVSENSTAPNKLTCKSPLENLRILAQTNDQTILLNPKDKSIIINKLGYGKSLKIFNFYEPIPDRSFETYFRRQWVKYISS